MIHPMFDQLVKVYRTAIAFMFAFVIALGVTAALAKYVPLLMAVLAVLIVARLIWFHTSRY